MAESFEFEALGPAVPEGSVKAFYIPKLKRTAVTHQNAKSLGDWRNRVATEAQDKLPEWWRCDDLSAYTIEMSFALPRPSSTPWWRRILPIVKPDLDKLVRAVNDALKDIVWRDDCQLVRLIAEKRYVDADSERRPGVVVKVSRYDNTAEKPPKKKKVA